MAAIDSLEALLTTLDRALRSVAAPARAARPAPMPAPTPGPLAPAPIVAGPDAAAPPAAVPVAAAPVGAAAAAPKSDDPADARRSAALMRVNHSGEVAAQALYHGQAAFASRPELRRMLLQAAREEADHLAWCEQRLAELGSRPSLLTPLWYAGSFAIGAAAAALGDRISLGFVAETERQVEGHLDAHLERLPREDGRSRAILEAMKRDESAHGAAARAAGAADFPPPVREAMRATARVMTFTSYWI